MIRDEKEEEEAMESKGLEEAMRYISHTHHSLPFNNFNWLN